MCIWSKPNDSFSGWLLIRAGLSVLHTVHVHFKEVKLVWTKMTRWSLFLNLSYIFLITSCFFFWLRGFLAFAVSTTSYSHSFVFLKQINWYPFSLPVRFKLWNLAVFCWFLSFCSDSAAIQTNQCLFVFFAKNFPASASKSRCEVSRPRAIGEYQYRGSFVGARLCNWGTS